MDKFLRTSRIVVIFIIIAGLLSIYGSTLYRLQIVEGDSYVEKNAGIVASDSVVYATRGSILDRNGTILAADETVYNVSINRLQMLNSGNANEIVYTLIQDAVSCGTEYTDTFPVTSSAPFDYLADMSQSQRTRLDAYIKYFNLSKNITAPQLIEWMREHYRISYTMAPADARKIIGVRYELEIRVIVNTTDYVFASDVDVDFITLVLQRNFGCVTVETASVRRYYTDLAAHVIGVTGRISSEEEFALYKDKGYDINDYVGKTGAEAGFEDQLHGIDGSVTTYTDSSGAVTGVVVNSQAQAGNNVYLTIDLNLQKAAEAALRSTINSINAEREAENAKVSEDEAMDLAEGGAVVLMDVNTGEVLAMASYPTFDLSTYRINAGVLNSDPAKPLFNRATQGTYNPGSTFKMVTAYAALHQGSITPLTTIYDEHTYTAFPDYQPSCWSPVSHGMLDVVGALCYSCNYFFYTIGDWMGARAISNAALEFGLGEKTGLEISEVSGHAATPEYKQEALNEGWWSADTLLASIGQGHNMFTPVQIANYVATIANGGTHYAATLLKYVTSGDYSVIVENNSPEILNVIEDEETGFIGLLQQGMRAVASKGTASSVFKNYKVPVAAKTGTVQSDTKKVNTGVFVCYAPADKPEIAIAVVVENGGSGSAISTCARDIMDAYFTKGAESAGLYSDNGLAD